MTRRQLLERMAGFGMGLLAWRPGERPVLEPTPADVPVKTILTGSDVVATVTGLPGRFFRFDGHDYPMIQCEYRFECPEIYEGGWLKPMTEWGKNVGSLTVYDNRAGQALANETAIIWGELIRDGLVIARTRGFVQASAWEHPEFDVPRVDIELLGIYGNDPRET